MRIVVLLALMFCIGTAEESTCYGTPKRGKLKLGKALPSSGINFESYVI